MSVVSLADPGGWREGDSASGGMVPGAGRALKCARRSAKS